MTNDPLGLFDEEPHDGDPLGLFEEEKKPKRNYALAALDSPLGMIEGATTGTINALGGVLAGAAGGLYGMAKDNMTAQEGYQKAQQKWADNVGKHLNARTESGKIAEDLMEKGIGSFKEYAADQGPKDLLGAIPFAGPQLAKDEKLGGLVSAAGTALPEVSMLLPFLGAKKGAARVPDAKKINDVVAQAAADAKSREDFMRSEKGSQGELFGKPDADPLGLFSEYDAGQAGVTEPISPKRAARQQELPFGDNQPSQINVDKLGEAVRSDANPNDLFARDAQAAKLQAEMEAQLAAQRAQERPGLTSLEGPDGQMSLFDQGDISGKRNQFNAGDLGDWRIDENGMPVRIDRTMEGQNLEAPLQRNLWGDELGPALDQGRSITAAIDNTPANGQWAQRRSQINRLGGRGQELPPSGELSAAAMEANGPLIPREDTSMFQPTNPMATERLGSLPEAPGTPPMDVPPQTPPGGSGGPRPWPMEPEVSSQITDKQGKPWDVKVTQQMVGQGTDRNLGVLVEVRDEQGRRAGVIDFTKNPDGTISAENTMVSPQMKGRGLAEAMYRAAQEAGYDAVPGRYQTPEGQKMVEALQKKGLIGEGSITPIEKHQMNVDTVVRNNPSETIASPSVEPLPPEQRPPVVDTVQTPRSPENIEAKSVQRRAAEHMPATSDNRLSEFAPVNTKEEAKALAIKEGQKDNAPGIIGRNTEGINWGAAMTDNPLIKFANTVFRDARAKAEKFSRTYITDKGGLAPVWSKMSGEERLQVAQLLMDGDKHQYRVDAATMDALNLSPRGRQWIEGFYKANDAMFDRWNQVLAEQGLKAVNRREGHVPSVFKGAYVALVTDEKGVTGVLAVDSRYQMAAAKKWFAENHPTHQIEDFGRRGLGGLPRGGSDIFSGMNDVKAFLSENDPRFAEIQSIIGEAIAHGNNSIFGFNKHELSKKGVIGNVGNRPWLDAKTNVDQWFKAMVQYFEEGALHHELQGPLRDVRELSLDKDLNMPKTMKYLDHYVDHVMGSNASNPVAGFANAAIDFGPKLLGFGPRATLQLAGTLKNNMSQLFMGWFNGSFMAAQLVQPFQTGLPFVQRAAQAMGNPARAPLAMFNGYTGFMLGMTERLTGKTLKSIPDHIREGIKYGEERGLMNFSEMERAYEGGKTAIGRFKDKAAELNMQIGELGTRMPVFLAILDNLHAGGMQMDRALKVAENMTQMAMIDYHQWERPPMYAKLGTLGQFAGGLTTFKHGYAGQIAYLGKRALTKGDIAPFGLAVAAMVAFAGIQGMPFYDELDNIFGELTDKFMDKRMNIRDAVMQNLPEWLKSGAIANASNVAIQSKFSSANMIPDYDKPGAALSPQLAAFGKIMVDAWDVGTKGDDQAFANFMLDISPATIKGGVEDKFFTKEREDGKALLLNRNRQGVIERDAESRGLRNWTGLRTNEEALQREGDFRARQAAQADKDAAKKISQDFGRSILNNKPDYELLKKYEKRAGKDAAKNLLEQFKERAIEANTTEKQRRDIGLKSNLGSLQQYDYYNKPGER